MLNIQGVSVVAAMQFNVRMHQNYHLLLKVLHEIPFWITAINGIETQHFIQKKYIYKVPRKST